MRLGIECDLKMKIVGMVGGGTIAIYFFNICSNTALPSMPRLSPHEDNWKLFDCQVTDLIKKVKNQSSAYDLILRHVLALMHSGQ